MCRSDGTHLQHLVDLFIGLKSDATIQTVPTELILPALSSYFQNLQIPFLKAVGLRNIVGTEFIPFGKSNQQFIESCRLGA